MSSASTEYRMDLSPGKPAAFKPDLSPAEGHGADGRPPGAPMHRLYPPDPRIPSDDSGAEHAVSRTLSDQLPDGDVLFHGLRIPQAAHQHEIDLLTAWPGVGLA